MLALPGSVWVTFENSAEIYQRERPRALFFPSRQCHLVYADTGQEAAVTSLFEQSGVGWSFQTADVLPNPWDQPVGHPSLN